MQNSWWFWTLRVSRFPFHGVVVWLRTRLFILIHSSSLWRSFTLKMNILETNSTFYKKKLISEGVMGFFHIPRFLFKNKIRKKSKVWLVIKNKIPNSICSLACSSHAFTNPESTGLLGWSFRSRSKIKIDKKMLIQIYI